MTYLCKVSTYTVHDASLAPGTGTAPGSPGTGAHANGRKIMLMRRFCIPVCLSALLLVFLTPPHAGGVTIYRIGGEQLDPPDLAESMGVTPLEIGWDDLPFAGDGSDVTFLQLPWVGVGEEKFGRLHLLETGEGSLGPERMDPTVNLTPLIRGRGGQVQTTDSYSWLDEPALDLVMDGDYDTAYQGTGIHYESAMWKGIWVVLDGILRIRRIVLQPTPEFVDERFLKSFELGGNDGDPRKKGTREGRFIWRFGFHDYDIWHKFAENTTRVLDLEIPDVPIKEILFKTRVGNWEIAEFEIYADGYVPQAEYVTNIIDLGGPASLGELTWSGDMPEDTRVDLTMRSGDDDDPNTYWRYTFRGDETSPYDSRGVPLTRANYERLEGGEKAGIRPESQNWDFWTPPLDFDAKQADLVGSKPRQYLQLGVELLSMDRNAGARLDYLQFEVTRPPFASQVLAEITPGHTDLGQVTPFRYKLRPSFGADDNGFDSIEIESPSAPTVDSVRIGSRILTRAEFGSDLGEDEFAVGPYDEANRRFVVRVPPVDLDENGELIEVAFQAEVYRVGTVFVGRVFDSTRPHEVRQRVTSGDADPLAENNSLIVQPTEVGGDVIRSLQVTPFSPNGDGINDVLQVEYELVNLASGVPVSLIVYDLAGRRVAEASAPPGGSGRFPAVWDGTDDAGDLLPPGVYLLRLEVETDRHTDIAVATVPLIY